MANGLQVSMVNGLAIKQLITEPPHIFGERWVGFQPTTYLYQPSIDLDLHHRPWLLTGATVRHRSAWSQWRHRWKNWFTCTEGLVGRISFRRKAKFGTPWWALGPARYPWAAWHLGPKNRPIKTEVPPIFMYHKFPICGFPKIGRYKPNHPCFVCNFPF